MDYSVKSEVKKHLNHVKMENIWKTQFSEQKFGLSIFTVKITFRQVLLSHIVI